MSHNQGRRKEDGNVFRWEINPIQIVILAAGMCIMYGQFSTRFEAYGESVRRCEDQTSRIEHYLSSQDKQYWQKVTQNGDARR